MINRRDPAENDAQREVSECYLSLLIELEAALSAGKSEELNPQTLAELSREELEDLDEARKCLAMLQRAAAHDRSQRMASLRTISFGAAEITDAALPQYQSGDQEDDVRPIQGARIGRFNVIQEIGQGGHGLVLLARDPTLKRMVALKVPQPNVLLTRGMRERFLAEGRAAALLAHPNIVTVYEAGEIGPVCYLAQEYVAGPTLSEWLTRGRSTTSPQMAAEIVAQLADGVEHAHNRGILHRDLKPSNVLLCMLSTEEIEKQQNSRHSKLTFVPKVSDFGIAKSLESDGETTATGTILGTPAYMSPEQAEGQTRSITTASDVYSLGAILFELLTGRPVFQAQTFLETIQLVNSNVIVRPRSLRSDVPLDLEAVCLKCLEKDPRRRYPSAFELAADLRRFLTGTPTAARPIKPRERIVRWCRRKPALSAFIGVSILALAALVANIAWSKDQLEKLLADANEQRERAELNQRLAVERETIARKHVYATDIASAQEAYHRGDISSAEKILARYVPADDQSDLRTVEWYYLRNLINNSSRLLLGHTGRLAAVSYSPKGELLASGAADGVIRVWNARAYDLIRSWHLSEPKEINAVAFSPDGSTLAAASDESEVRLWSISTGDEIKFFKGHVGWVADVCFSPNGKLLATAGSDKTVRLWDVASGKPVRVLEGHRDTVRAVRFLLDGTLLASTSEDQTVRLWNVEDGTPLLEKSLNPPKGREQARPTSMVVSPDGNQLAVCLEGTFVRLWRIVPPGTLEPLRDFVDEQVRTVAFSRDGKDIEIGTNDAKVYQWNVATQNVTRVLRGHRQQILDVTASLVDDVIATGSRDGELRIWNLRDDGQEFHKLARLPWTAKDFAVSTDGRCLILGGEQSEYIVLDSRTGATVRAAALPPKGATVGVGISRDGRWIVSANGQQACRVWDASTGALVQEFAQLLHPSGRVIVSKDDMLVASHGQSLDLLDLKTRQLRATLEVSDSIRAIEASPDGRYLALGVHNGEIWICDAADLRLVRKLFGHYDGVHDVSFSPVEPLLCSAGDDFSVRLWNWQTGELIRTFGSEGGVGCLSFSADGRTIIGKSGNSKLHFWNVDTGRETLEVDFPGAVNDVEFSADGGRIYVLLNVHDTESGIYVLSLLSPSIAGK